MHARCPVADSAAGTGRLLARAALAAAIVICAAGCGAATTSGVGGPAGGGKTAATGTRCGTAHTAANVPVNVVVQRGQVACSTAMKVERSYARAILAGRAPGAGGGGPVHVLGWTCRAFPTPQVLRTGQASKCVSGSAEILAILPSPA